MNRYRLTGWDGFYNREIVMEIKAATAEDAWFIGGKRISAKSVLHGIEALPKTPPPKRTSE